MTTPKIFILDAEELAEGSIAAAYKDLVPELLKYVKEADEITEVLDDKAPSYSVHHRDHEYVIYEPENEDASWDNATYALFSIMNTQLVGSRYRLYAINAGNDLGGMFLTSEQYESAKRRSSGNPSGLISLLTSRRHMGIRVEAASAW